MTNYYADTSGTASDTALNWTGWVQDANATGSWRIWMEWATTTTTTVTYTGTAQIIPEREWAFYTPSVWQHATMGPESDKAYRKRLRAAARAEAKLKAEKEAAVARAEELLKENLDEVQARDYAALQAFLVRAPSGSTYRIRKGRSGNVTLLNEAGQDIESFCIHPSVEFPDQDAMLAQKLLLETDEATFRRIANVTALRAA